jgi:hypothetical protein
LNRKILFAWLTVCSLLLGAIAVPAAVSAAPSFTYVGDDAGANDEPGQKDLTAQSSDADNGVFYTSWKWDDIQWTGGNTGDGCSLFDTDVPDNGLVDYALCATVKGGKDAATVQLVSFKLYSCVDTRADRCAGPTTLVSKVADAGSFCTVIDSDTGQFDATDTTIICNISTIAAEAGITVIGSGTLLNTCSYPSREPNSDPSDCVLTIIPDDTTTVTTPSGSATFTATLNDSAQVTPAAAGNVVFKLFSDSTCATQVFTATSATNAAGVATTTTSVSAAGTYYWTADFTPTDPTAFNPSASACGAEVVTVTAPTVS